MNSVCISNDAHIPNRATYVNLHRWPESDAEFIKSVTAGSAANVRKGVQIRSEYSLTCAPRVVDSISCRQMYLRSYPFSKKKETVQEKISKKCFGKVKKEKVVVVVNRKRRSSRVRVNGCGKRCTVMMSRVRKMSCAALYSIFRKLLFCSATVDVADHSEM